MIKSQYGTMLVGKDSERGRTKEKLKMGRRSKHWGGTTWGVKKISDEDFIRLELEGRRQGWSTGRIANEMGISWYGRNKRLPKHKNEIDRRWIAEKGGLKPEELQFCENIANGMATSKAATLLRPDVHGVRQILEVATDMKSRKEVQDMLRLLFEQKGIGIERRVERIRDHIESMDPGTSLKALDMSFKLDGLMSKDIADGGGGTTNIMIDLSAYKNG